MLSSDGRHFLSPVTMAKFITSFLAVIAVASVASAVSVAPRKSAALSENACKTPFQNIGSGCYYFGGANLRKNWWQSAEYCRIIGGNLLTIEDPVENQDIQDHLLRNFPKGNFYAGGYDLGHEGTWYWQATLKPFEFTDWMPPQPDNQGGHQNCLTLDSVYAFHWDDKDCSLIDHGFICEA